MKRNEFDALLVEAIPDIEKKSRFYASMFGMPSEWRDIAQEAMLRMLACCRCFDGDKGSLQGYAGAAIRNLLCSRAASKSTDADLGEARTVRSESDSPEWMADRKTIRGLMSREAQLFAEGYTYGEIAGIVGVRSRTTVKERIDRSAQSLASVLGMEAKPSRRPNFRRASTVNNAQKIGFGS